MISWLEKLVLRFVRWVIVDALRLTPEQAAIVILVLLVLASAFSLVGFVYLLRNDPMLLTVRFPYLFPRYPSDGLEKLIPKEREGKVVVLSQRKVMDLDHWRVAEDPSHCKPEGVRPGLCDEAHVYESWTVIVPESNAHLSLTGLAFAWHEGEVVALTPHTISFQDLGTGKHQWTVTNYTAPPGYLDVVIIRQDLHGAFQPESVLNSQEPQVIQCLGNWGGIGINNPTARAELMIHTPPDMPIDRGSLRIWRRIDGQRTEEITQAGGRNGNYVAVDPHTIHWALGRELLRDADSQRVTYQVSWLWQQPITTGPVCGRSTSIRIPAR